MFLFISIALVILFVVLAIIGGTNSKSKNKRQAQQNDMANIAPSTNDKTSNLAKFDAFPCDMVQAYCDTLSSYPVKQLLSQGKQLEPFTALDAAQEAANALLSGAKYTSDTIFRKRSYPK